MATKKTVKWFATGGLVLGVALLGGTAWATNMYGPNNTCTENNCGARVIQGTVTAFGPTAQPWVAEIFSPSGQCFRLAVTAEGQDLKTVVSAPNGQVFRNDDGGEACFLCPVVKIAHTPNNGWYTVSINQWTGAAVNANFTMLYSTYNVGNPNCANPTNPINPLEHAPQQQKSPQLSPPHHEEGTPGAS